MDVRVKGVKVASSMQWCSARSATIDGTWRGAHGCPLLLSPEVKADQIIQTCSMHNS